MKAVSLEHVSFNPDGTQNVRATIVSDDTPSTLPLTGENVDGMTAKQRFAPMSVLYVVADVEPKLYMANESGEFIAQ